MLGKGHCRPVQGFSIPLASLLRQNAVETLQSQRKEEQQQEPLRDRGHQQGAGLRPEQTEQERREEVDCPDRKEEEQKEVACLRDQLHNKAHMVRCLPGLIAYHCTIIV